MNPIRVAAIGAHPDDIEIFIGGSMAAWKARGADLHFIVATDGSRGGGGDPQEPARRRAAEAGRAAALLGADLHALGWPDGVVHPGAGEIATMRDILARIAPDLVVTHAPNDYHADHRAVSAIAASAVGFSRPVLWCDTLMGTGFVPNHYVDVTVYFEAKCRAIRCHRSQEPERFVELAVRQNGFRAGQCGGLAEERAEAFRFEPVYPFADIRDLLPPAPPIRPIVDRAKQAAAAGTDP